MPLDLICERNWALYKKSTGGTWLTTWYLDDSDVFESGGITYTRIGPVVRAYTPKRARELIDEALRATRS